MTQHESPAGTGGAQPSVAGLAQDVLVAELERGREKRPGAHRASAESRAASSDGDVPALELANIDFSYGQVQVLFDVTIDVLRGETLALLGTNGAGKSTILRMISGLGKPTRGDVRLHGKSITGISPERRARMGIQLLPGGKGVFPALSVQENIEVGAFAYRRNRADMRARMDRAFDMFPALAEKREQRAGSLSGGQQQMVALARVLLHDPDVILIDELSLGLAPVVVQELIGVVEQLKESGATVVVVEQSLNVAAVLCERAIFLEKGQVRFDGLTRDLIDRDDLARAVFFGTGER